MLIDRLDALGYDGIVYQNRHESAKKTDSYIALRPEQIKSAVGNAGTFDPKSKDILASVTQPISQRPGLFDLPPVEITELTGNELSGNLGHPLSNKELRSLADRLLQNIRESGERLHNQDTGWLFDISLAGQRKMGSNPHMARESTQSVAVLRQLVDRAVLAESHRDAKRPQVDAVHRFYAPAMIADKLYRVRLTVLDFRESGWAHESARYSSGRNRKRPAGNVAGY